MLERASLTAECTAHLLLRRIELPTRSRRSLGPTFWRHGGDELDVPAWWPIYLENIRQKTVLHPVFSNLSPVTIHGQCPTRPSENIKASRNVPDSVHTARDRQRTVNRSRAFGSSLRRGQEAARSPEISSSQENVAERLDETNHQQDFSQPNDGHGFAPFIHNTSKTARSGTKRGDTVRVAEQVEQRDPAEYESVWQLFISSGQKHSMASHVLRFLSTSNERRDQRRAISAFAYIANDERTRADYETFGGLATDLRYYRLVVQNLKEVVDQTWGQQMWHDFFAYCLQNMLWNTLATLWKATPLMRQRFHGLNKGDPGLHTAELVENSAQIVKRTSNLVGKIEHLANRLKSRDAVLAAQQPVLVDICQHLAFIAAQSDEIISRITAEGVLALVNIQEQLRIASQLHLAVLGTINRMHGRGAKSQLAILVYRNLRFTRPDDYIPKWVFGTLIAICTDGHQPTAVYEWLLEEFKSAAGRPDLWAFRKVLEACARDGDVSAVSRIFEDFRAAGGPQNIKDVNYLIYVHAVTGNKLQARVQFSRIQKDFGFTPDVVTWSTLMLAHARSSDPSSAFGVLEQMKAANVLPNEVTWSTLMSIAAKQGDTQQVERLFREAGLSSDNSSVYLTSSLVECYLANDQVKEAQKLVARASGQQGQTGTVRLWNSLIRYHAFKADSQRIAQTQTLMQGFGVQADGMTYAALMTALVLQNKTENAARLLRKLHGSRDMQPTAFHYTILIYGFAREGKRDRATVFYHELKRSFPHVTAGARLAMLHVQVQRDRDANVPPQVEPTNHMFSPLERQGVYPGRYPGIQEVYPTHAFSHVSDSLLANSPQESLVTTAHPGFGRRNPRGGINTIFLQSLVGFLQSNAAFERAGLLLTQIDGIAHEAENKGTGNSKAVVMSTNILKLTQAVDQRQWRQAEEAWQLVLSGAMNISRPADGASAASKSGSRIDSSPETFDKTLATGLGSFTSMFPSGTQGTTITAVSPPILPAQRFMLSRPLSIYMQALDYQTQHWKIVELVEDLESKGFALSSNNWNRYIQCLSKSPDFAHRAMAFQLFEQHMLPNAPTWDLIRRGRGLLPSSANTKSKAFRRTQLEKLQPEVARPSYFTMIHLATVLVKAYQNEREMKTLSDLTPGTLKLVKATPYLRDRMQGVLMRGRRVIGDPDRRPRAEAGSRNVSGILGGKSQVDNIPISALEAIEAAILTENNAQTSQSQDVSASTSGLTHNAMYDVPRAKALAPYLKKAELESGPIDQGLVFLPTRERYETKAERVTRINDEVEKKLAPSIRLAEQASGEILRRRLYLTKEDRYEDNDERDDRITSEMVQKVRLLDNIQQEVSHRPSNADGFSGLPPTVESAVAQPANITASPRIRRLAYALKQNTHATTPSVPRDEAVMARQDMDISTSTSSSDESKTTARKGKSNTLEGRLAKPDEQKTILWRDWSGLNSYPAINTRVFNRKIEPVYTMSGQPGIPPTRKLTHRMRNAFTINKAKRRQKLESNQSFLQERRRRRQLARMEQPDDTEQGVHSATGASTNISVQGQRERARVENLAMPRGARRAG